MENIDVFMLTMIGFSLVLSIASAALLAYNKVNGWGWFLFIAFFIAVGIKVN